MSWKPALLSSGGRGILVILVLLAGAVRPGLAAQASLTEIFRGQLEQGVAMRVVADGSTPARPASSEEAMSWRAVDSTDHRWEGAAVGAVLGAVFVTYISQRVCEEDCGMRAIGSIIGGAVLGGFVGLLIGGAIPKTARPVAEGGP
jgi:hypothetical protein